MKKIFFALLTSTLLFACGGGSSSSSSEESATLIPEKFNYQFLTNEAELKTLMDGIFNKLGNNIHKLDNIDISVNRPSKIGFIKKPDAPDHVYVTLRYLNPQDPKTLQECNYNFDERKWDHPKTKTVKLMLGDAESFVLADEMYDASALTSDKVAQIVKIAWDKYKDDTKYSDQWVKRISIEKGEVSVQIEGLLESNGLDKRESHTEKL